MRILTAVCFMMLPLAAAHYISNDALETVIHSLRTETEAEMAASQQFWGHVGEHIPFTRGKETKNVSNRKDGDNKSVRKATEASSTETPNDLEDFDGRLDNKMFDMLDDKVFHLLHHDHDDEKPAKKGAKKEEHTEKASNWRSLSREDKEDVLHQLTDGSLE